nr:MAG TPA: hypothetical protein [Caudoviricetes sp.]
MISAIYHHSFLKKGTKNTPLSICNFAGCMI